MLPSVKKAPNSGKKCKGKKAKQEPDMDKARRDFKTKLMGARKLPDGLRKQTIDAIQNYYQNNNLTDYNVQKALNPTKTELLHRFHKMVDMSIEELWDLAILDMQEELAGVIRGTAEPEGPKDEELRVCSTTLAQVIRKEFSERDVAAVEEKLVEKRDVLSDYTQEICALALQATVLVRIEHVEYSRVQWVFYTRYCSTLTYLVLVCRFCRSHRVFFMTRLEFLRSTVSFQRGFRFETLKWHRTTA